MREFDLDLLIGKDVAVNCRTKKEEAEFLAYLDNKGIKWCNGNNIFDNNDYNFSYYNKNTCFCINDDNHLSHSEFSFYLDTLEYKIIYLDDLIKPKNNFKEYGFEADFEGEILKEYENQFVGMVYQNEGNFGCSWDKKGRCLQPDGFGYVNMNLKPIKKEWYENPDNFPCIATKDGKNFAVIESIDYLKRVCIYPHIIDFRPATKEEVLSLLVKE